MSQTKPEAFKGKIEFIESHLSEDLLLNSEELYDKEPVLRASELSAGQWETIIEDQNIHFTTSVNLKNDNLVAYSCDCISGRKKELCKHIVVSLFHIRKQHKTEIAKAKVKKSRPRLNLRGFLEKIDHDHLQGFAFEYARKNRSFRLVLQARFISELEEAELPTFFESIYPTHTKTGQKVTAANLSIFISVSNELLDYFKGLIHSEEYTKAYFLAHQLLVKSFYIKNYIKGPHKGFDTVHDNLLKNYKECHRLIEAPEYREHMISQLVELLSSSFIDAADIAEQELWMIAYEHPLYYSILRQSISDYLNRKSAHPQGKYFISMLSLMISEPDNWIEKINELSPQDTYQLVQILLRHNSYDSASEILKCILINKDINHTICKNILESTSLELDAKLENAIIECYIRLKNKYYLEYLKANSKDWSEIRNILIPKISAINNDKLLIEFHIYNQEVKEAATIISQSNSWKFLQEFDTSIVELNKEEGYNLYLSYILNYLQDHFGIVAAEHLEIVLFRARRFGGDKWVRKLRTNIQTTFPHRAW